MKDITPFGKKVNKYHGTITHFSEIKSGITTKVEEETIPLASDTTEKDTGHSCVWA
jgi:hypothetical protein